MESMRTMAGCLLLTAAWALPAAAATGTISASPSTLVINSGQLGTSTISWSTSGAPTAQVWVSVDGAPETLFATSPSGSASAPWIQPGFAYRFTLYEGTAHTVPLAAATVLGVRPGGGTITGDPFVVRAPYNGTGTAALRWATQGFGNAEVWVSMDGAPEAPMAGGPSGTASPNWIQPGHDYLFRLYGGTSRSQLLDTVRVYGDLSYEVGVNYHATGADFLTTAFLTRYHLPGVRDTVRAQLQDMANRGATVIKHSLWMVTSPGGADFGEAWRAHFPLSTQEATNLRTFAQDVAAIQMSEGRRFKLDLMLGWLGDADYQRGTPATALGWANLPAAQFTTRVNQTVASVVNAVQDVLRPDGRRVVDTIYLAGEVMIGAKANEEWFLTTHYPGFVQTVKNAGLTPSLYFLVAGNEAEVLDNGFVDSTYPVLNGHRSMFWVYRSLRFLRDSGLELPRRVDFSAYPARSAATHATLVQRIFDDADATLPSLGLARRYGAVETFYLTSNAEREALGDAFAAQRLINGRLERVIFWTTPDAGGPGVHVGFPFEVEDYWP